MGFHIGRAGLLGEAELVWLPEISQPDLSHIARAIFIAMHRGGELRTAAETLYSALRVRADDARRRVGTSDPADLGEAMLALEEKAYDRRGESLEGVRLLPLGRRIVGEEDIFPDILDYWNSENGPFGKLPAEAWLELFEKTRKAA
jgi:hypothetical protein